MILGYHSEKSAVLCLLRLIAISDGRRCYEVREVFATLDLTLPGRIPRGDGSVSEPLVNVIEIDHVHLARKFQV